MPDEWATFFGINDPNADPEGDGRTNFQEFQEGTNPLDNSSFRLRIISIVRSGNNIVITFNGVAGETFQLQRKAALSGPGEWASIPEVSNITPSTAGNAQFTHIGGASADRAFYWVRLVPERCAE